MKWDTDDQDKALAWTFHEADKCPGCGRHSYEDVTISHVICQTCKKRALYEASDDFRRKVGALIMFKERNAE